MVNPLVFQIFSATSPALHPIASATESVTPPATAAGQRGFIFGHHKSVLIRYNHTSLSSADTFKTVQRELLLSHQTA
jgi:hypothetical protein